LAGVAAADENNLAAIAAVEANGDSHDDRVVISGDGQGSYWLAYFGDQRRTDLSRSASC
jgi:hypothetical protein